MESSRRRDTRKASKRSRRRSSKRDDGAGEERKEATVQLVVHKERPHQKVSKKRSSSSARSGAKRRRLASGDSDAAPSKRRSSGRKGTEAAFWAEFRDLASEVTDFGATGFRKREKRRHDAAKLEKLGLLAGKKHQHSLQIRKGLARREKDIRKKWAKEEKEGSLIRHMRQVGTSRRAKHERRRAERRKNPGVDHQHLVGSYRDGVLRIR
eukprot:PLAT3907.1.p1 GENE.PLAT3907.1~~PLAT3907.1.p1  ORF type:complete len:210 (-),score=64.99 PLAT3907.1:53-682(-)